MSAQPGKMRQGDFSKLAEDYSKYRPSYSPSIVNLCDRLLVNHSSRTIVDIGAGTGIWSREVSAMKNSRTIAIEPNSAMRAVGIRDSAHFEIEWREGGAEVTGLEGGIADLVTMASSFHWADFELATKEFKRILKPNGVFVCHWNSRNLEMMPKIQEMEDYQFKLNPKLERKSSGRSKYVQQLGQKFEESKVVSDFIYFEKARTEIQSRERYLGAWRSSNDVQAQLGAENWAMFLDHLEKNLSGVEKIEVHYKDLGWVCFF